MTEPDLVDVVLELVEKNKELEDRLRVACETIDDLVRPLTQLVESVGDVAVELIRDCLDGKD